MTRILLLTALACGCADNLQIDDTNLKPTAVARVLGDPQLGELRLDGSASSDPDGSIRVYRWLSATPLADDDAGANERWVPSGAPADWPDDVVQPKLTLAAAGTYAFTLWVIDDRGLVSDPSHLTVQLEASP
jgi:hypothetical protein